MRVDDIINGAVYYGSAMLGGVSQAVKLQAAGVDGPEPVAKIVMAAAISAVVGGVIKEGISYVFYKIFKK